MQKENFLKYIGILGTVFQDKKVNDMFVDIYYERLKNIDEADFKEAINQCIDNCQFFPKPVELIKYAKEKSDERNRHERIEMERKKNRYIDIRHKIDFHGHTPTTQESEIIEEFESKQKEITEERLAFILE